MHFLVFLVPLWNKDVYRWEEDLMSRDLSRTVPHNFVFSISIPLNPFASFVVVQLNRCLPSSIPTLT